MSYIESRWVLRYRTVISVLYKHYFTTRVCFTFVFFSLHKKQATSLSVRRLDPRAEARRVLSVAGASGLQCVEAILYLLFPDGVLLLEHLLVTLCGHQTGETVRNDVITSYGSAGNAGRR